jgi:hypothetical protein
MDIREQMQSAKFRVILKSRENGGEFPIYTEREEEAEEAAKALNAEVVSVNPAGSSSFAVDLINALATGSNVINK